MNRPDNEKQLIAQAKKGNKEAVSALYEAYADAIFQYLSYRVESHMVAEDITSEVFLRMVQGLPKFEDRGVPFGAWLFRIAVNLLNEYYRQNKKMTWTVLSDETRSDEADPSDHLEEEEEHKRLREAIQTLPQDYQDVLVLRFMQNLPYAQVAAILNKSELALRSLQHRALKALGEKLDSTSNKHRSYLRGKGDADERE